MRLQSLSSPRLPAALPCAPALHFAIDGRARAPPSSQSGGANVAAVVGPDVGAAQNVVVVVGTSWECAAMREEEGDTP